MSVCYIKKTDFEKMIGDEQKILSVWKRWREEEEEQDIRKTTNAWLTGKYLHKYKSCICVQELSYKNYPS